MPWRSFLSPEFIKQFRRKVPLFRPILSVYIYWLVFSTGLLRSWFGPRESPTRTAILPAPTYRQTTLRRDICSNSPHPALFAVLSIQHRDTSCRRQALHYRQNMLHRNTDTCLISTSNINRKMLDYSWTDLVTTAYDITQH